MASTAQKKAKATTKASKERGSKDEVEIPETWESRAVLRLIEPGSVAECPQCGERVKFRARHRDQQVICNVYDDGIWQRVEQYHQDCYDEADAPYGPAVKN